MAPNPKLRQIIDEAQLRAKAEKWTEKFGDYANDDAPEVVVPSLVEQLVVLGLRKATKQELRQIILSRMAADAA